MIRPNTKIGIIFSYNSKNYADQLREIINEYRNDGYCIEAVMIDDDFVSNEINLGARVFNNLSQCDYAFVFLTKDLEVVQDDGNVTYVSRPNVTLELGFLRGCTDENSMYCIIDFPNKDINDGKYILPSDISGWYRSPIDPNNSFNDIKKEFINFLNSHENGIMRLANFNVENLTRSLILNKEYKTDYRGIFLLEQFKSIEKYSLKFQLDEILRIWLEEKSRLGIVEQIIYLYERIVFFPFFPNDFIDKLNTFLSIDLQAKDAYTLACYEILQNIRKYEIGKRQNMTVESPIFYLNIAENIQKFFKIFEGKSIAPIIECVTQDYMGLAFLNFCIKSQSSNSVMIEEKYTFALKNAKDCFLRVIELSEHSLGDSTYVFVGFAKFNLARAHKMAKEEAEQDYNEAVNRRWQLANTITFPELFRLNFSIEKIHAQINFFEYMLSKERLNPKDFKKQIVNLRNEVNKLKQTPVANLSLFLTIENTIQLRLNEK